MCRVYEVYEMLLCNGLGMCGKNRHVSPGDISYVPGRCPVVHFIAKLRIYQLLTAKGFSAAHPHKDYHYSSMPI